MIHSNSVITCPVCAKSKEETMPVIACLHFYTCSFCKTLLSPKKGYCCVFCSYGSVPCPPIQIQGELKNKNDIN